VNLYDAGNLRRTWMLGGIIFQIPAGISLPPNGRLLITGRNPAELCQSGQAPAGMRVTGPLFMPLSDQALSVTLLRPFDWGANGAWAPTVTDELHYRNVAPWPGIGANLALGRSAPTGFGGEPASWRAAPVNDLGAVDPAASSTVCAFDVFLNKDNQMEIQWAAAPLGTATFEPDVVTIYCDTSQLVLLLMAREYKTGENLPTALSGHAACVYGVIPAVRDREYQVAVPCRGDHITAMAGDDEMIFTVPMSKFDEFMQGLRTIIGGEGKLTRMPMIHEMKPGAVQPDSYSKMATLMGMDVSKPC
jgi:hypothetical protein